MPSSLFTICRSWTKGKNAFYDLVGSRCKRLIATTATHYKGEAPLNIALIDVGEGFRMMSRVEGIGAMDVKIGMRVKVKILPGDGCDSK